ncbi:MAG: tRNA (adenosine(37)-N6)-threonylcarbamoyltransferase complex dimerization subunit type 1 TsaB [Actinobacteria bacterium 13_1_20CM_3_71_11]|nr:MAG: tRNA (adenosine(37)-N6)-threonylcarbamoyltransferase complex dimerization subunit type 1 TsaB [Actinobacteria bacterium 13_1_20CM_3_71_11]
MLIVVVDSATPAITAALAKVTDADARLLARRVTVDARAHGELLAPAIEAVLQESGVRPRELGAVVAGIGPGPFTGLRVGLVTAAALADSLAIPAYGVGTLDAIGWATTGRVLVATDARRKEVYWAVYENGRPVTEPAVDKPASLDVEVDHAVGDGALHYASVLRVPVRDEPRYPPAEGLVALAAGRIRDKAPTEPLTPLYLRRPDAVEPGTRKAVLP